MSSLCLPCGQLDQTADRKTRDLPRIAAPGCQWKARQDATVAHALIAVPQYFSRARLGPPRHRLFALEYHCPSCKETTTGGSSKSLMPMILPGVQKPKNDGHG